MITHIPRRPRQHAAAAFAVSAATLILILLGSSCRTTPQAPPPVAIPSAENLLPSDTLLLVTVPDFASLRAAAHQSPQWLFWNDPAMKPFHDKFMVKWNEEVVAPLERDLGVKLDDYTSLPQGQLTLAVTQNGWNGNDDPKPGVLLLLDAKDKGSLLKTNLAALRKKWVDANKPVRTETICGIEFSVVSLSSNDVPKTLAKFFPPRQPVPEPGRDNKPPPPGELFVGQFESLLIAGSSARPVETVAKRLTGGSLPPLSGNAFYAADRLVLFRDAPLYYGWFNAKTFFDVLVHVLTPQPNPEAPGPTPQIPWDKILGASGMTGLKTAAFSYRETHDGSQINIFLSAPEAGRQGIFKMIAADQKDATPPAFVPADAVKYWRWRVDGRKSWAAFEKMLADISPAALNSINFMLDTANAAAQQKDPNFDIRKNLIGNLGDDFISYQKTPRGTTLADLNSAPSLFLFASPNAEPAASALKSAGALMGAQDNAPSARDFLGRKIYTITLPPRYTPGAAAPAPRALYCAASGGYVALTADVSTLEEYLRSNAGQAQPLRETAGLANAGQHVGGMGGGLFGYENQREIMRGLFTTLKNDPSLASDGLNAFGGLPWGASGNSIRDWLDFSLLPDFDKVSKYFSCTVYGGSTTVDGLSFKFFTPRPPQMENNR
jgi:hypothetical protein